MLPFIATITTFAAAGGWIGWLLGTRAMEERLYYDVANPVFMNVEHFARGNWRRVATSGAYALLGGCAGLGALLILVR